MTSPKNYRIRVTLKAFEVQILNLCCQKIINTFQKGGATIKGPIYIPTHRRIYCVLRSPHVDKDSREHFEIRTHKRIIEIYTSSPESFPPLQMPTGIFFDVQRL
jgi:small subunit ribosomal protein S10|uniref:ribosomal protein S10 n=1 Tax=Fibrocapsa japonica TaxID=94617 RepID=UPI0021159A7B|nr:ribosomal protein S10 [Fibrocapsa japonica]UTE95131.1 ribosomal protein S10 [Fibrocapsa japonica]